MNNYAKYIDIKEDVLKAIERNEPILALESTIISHGMSYPDNFNTAITLEKTARDNGVIPATIAIIDGRIKIGLEESEIKLIASSKEILKVSRRDIPFVLATGKTGATTVASTMIFAELVGIKVFSTGGIGGVHRGADKTFDISADLYELSSTNVAVVCAGAKSILDIGLTLEKLETLGVLVLGYKTEEFPSFYNRSSGFKVDYKVMSPGEIADILKLKWDLDLKGGVVIANPIEAKYETSKPKIDSAINTAFNEARIKNIRGKEVTPYMLERIKELTVGESLESNIELVKSNVDLGAKIAKAYNSLEHKN